jgi:CheY-like chemotaxis protein
VPRASEEEPITRILIIDDEAAVRDSLRGYLERVGYEVLEAPNGRVGLRLHKEKPVDLIITDIFMPDGDGIEVIRAVRRTAPQLKVITVSGGEPPGPWISLNTPRASAWIARSVNPSIPQRLSQQSESSFPRRARKGVARCTEIPGPRRRGVRSSIRFSRQSPAFVLENSGTDARNPPENRQLDVFGGPPDSHGVQGVAG